MATRTSRVGRDIDLVGVPAVSEDVDSDAALAPARGYCALPATGSGPGVVVIQEAWGQNDNIRDVCDRLAREGFVALAPDLYRGESADDAPRAERLMMDLDLPRAGDDLDRAVVSLLSQDATQGSRVGCIGFSMGGQLALFAACANARIGAVVDCYGLHPNVNLDFSEMRSVVLGVFAENDDFVPPAAVEELERLLRDAGIRAECKVHVGVGHGFLNDSRPDAYDAPTARVAWNDILAFLRAELS